MKKILLLALASMLSMNLFAQLCTPAGGFGTGTGNITTTPGDSNCYDRAFSIGDNVTMTGLIPGYQYTVSTCGESGSFHPAPYDSYIGIWNAAGTVFITESFGGSCGNGDDERVTFTATATSHLAILRSEACGLGFQLHDLCVKNEGPTCMAPAVPTLSVSPNPVCPGGSSTITITGNLNDATAWQIYTGSCGGTNIGNTSASTYLVSPLVTTTYFIRGEGGCVTPGSCGTVTLTAQDITDPTIACPGNQSVYTGASCQFSLPNYTGLAVASDNCTASPVITQTPVPGTTLSGTSTVFVTLTATDGASNTASCNFNVSVYDTVSPTAVCQNITLFLDGAGNATMVAADIDGGSTDNCVTSQSASQTAFTCTNTGPNNVTLTVMDGSGNTSNCVATVTVFDTISPTAVCQNITVFLDGAGTATITAADIDGGSSDNCGSVNLSASQTSFTCTDLGSNNVTLTVMDGSGNTSNCVSLVTVFDTISPTVVCPADQYICHDTISDFTGLATASDNCDASPVITQSPVAGTVISVATVITLTAADASANSSQCTFTVFPNNSSTATDVITACGSYTWIDGTTYTASNNTATYTLINMASCDSLVSLDLTINTVDTSTVLAGATITANATGATYQWLDCDSAYAVISGETNQSHTAIANGNYAVEVVQNGCTDTSYCISIITVGIDHHAADNSICLYPNPTNGKINIEFGEAQKEVQVIIRDISGRAIAEHYYGNAQKIICHVVGSPGLYFIEITSPLYNAVFKLMKQ